MNSSPPRNRRRSINSALPSLLTLASCCAGLTAVRHAVDGQVTHALFFILAAAILDGLDGTVARWLKATSHFGGELDSLADFVAFGVAPALIVYFLLFDGASLGALFWGVSLLYAACCGLRLARFNVLSLNPDPEAKPEPFFRGIPAPGGGMCALMPLALLQLMPELAGWPYLTYAYAAWLVFTGLMMVSSIPTFSPKKLRFPQKYNLVLILFSLVVVLIAYERPWLVWVIITSLYLLTIPFMAIKLHRTKG